MAQKLEKLDTPITVIEVDDADVTEDQHGFLPFETNWFDRAFLSVWLWVAISLFWFRFLEPIGLSIWIGVAVSVALGVFIVRKG